ncbi:MAG: hypothetical protein RIT24_1118 [Planctomycetota bacterium]
MGRPHDERSTLRPLLAALERQFRASAGDWAARFDARILRRYQRELADVSERLEGAGTDLRELDRSRSLAAEMLVAARLLESGCTVEYEVETPAGKHVDFRARRDGATLCIHVKRAPQPTLRDAQVSIPAAWRALETVDRGLVIALSLARNLRGKPLLAALDDAFTFVEQASVGDELALRDSESRIAARLRVIAPSTQRRVEIVADLSASFDDHVPRFQSTLRKAFAQFLPRSENLIVVCGSAGGIDAFATALLGSQIERWDKRPRVGELVAYGRGGDGFWAGSMRNQSRLAAYWTLAKGNGPLLFLREPASRAPSPAIDLARAVFA